MSVQAEHRWQRKLVNEAAERETTFHTRAVFESINAVPLAPNANRLFCETVVRESRNGFDLMNRQVGGWASSGRWYRTLRQCMAHTNMVIIGCGSDTCSFFYRVRPAKAGERQ